MKRQTLAYYGLAVLLALTVLIGCSANHMVPNTIALGTTAPVARNTTAPVLSGTQAPATTAPVLGGTQAPATTAPVLGGTQAPATTAPVLEGTTAPVAVVAQAPDLAADLTTAEVHELFANGEALIIDVRQPDEYDAGHIPGATLIPLDALPNRLSEVPRDQPVVVVCRSGNRSSQAQRYLQDQGFTNIHNMLGGMNNWSAKGYELEP